MRAQEERRLVCEAGRMLIENHLAARTWGNVSCRTGEETMLITPSGMDYIIISPQDIVPFDMARETWEGARKPSSEYRIHMAAYRPFPRAGFVFHTHQVYASALALTGPASLSLSAAQEASLGGLAFAAYALPGTKRLAANVAAAFATGAQTVLLARHGALIVGRDREEAFSRALLLEELCQRACKGQPQQGLPVNAALAQRLIEQAKAVYGFAETESSPPALACAKEGHALPALLDDAAQMIGRSIPAVRPEEKAALRALGKSCAVLVPGVGALCRAESAGDCAALRLLTHKACVAALHTRALGEKGRLSPLDVLVMRVNYRVNYSKKIGG